MSIRRFLKAWLPTLFWAIIIFSFSSKTTPTTSAVYWQDFVVKKTAHLFVYAVLSVLIYRSLKLTTGYKRLYLLLFTLTLTILYAITDEFHQSFTFGREPTIRDVIIDIIGGTAGLSAFLKLNLPQLPQRHARKKN